VRLSSTQTTSGSFCKDAHRSTLRWMSPNGSLLNHKPTLHDSRLHLTDIVSISPSLREAIANFSTFIDHAIGKYRDTSGTSHTSAPPSQHEKWIYLVIRARSSVYQSKGITHISPTLSYFDPSKPCNQIVHRCQPPKPPIHPPAKNGRIGHSIKLGLR
jgi:hypothetical protein